MNNFVHFPIGQKSVDEEYLTIQADSVIKEYLIVDDDFGGRWVKVAFNKLNKNSIVKVIFIKKSGPLILLPQTMPVPDMWIHPTNFIDCNHPAIIDKSKHLTNGIEGTMNKAKNIQIFVGDFIKFHIYKDSGLVSASETLQNKYGTCINYARLFVALCRATGIPARSVWGSIKSGYSYNSHHSWAEFLDDDGFWHTVDMSYTKSFNLNDMRYLDLMYAAEENKHCKEFEYFTISSQGDYYFYDASPSAVDGKLNAFILTDNLPDEVEISMSYEISRLFEN